MANTMTYAQAIEIAVKALGDTNPEAVDRLNKLTEQLAKRSSGSKGLTKTQKQNEVIKEMIKDILSEAEKPIGMVTLIAVEKSKDKKHVVYTLVAEQ